MMQQPMLSQDEWGLILELLRQERQNLPPEIRRTDTPRVHDELQERMKMVDELIARVRQSTVGEA